MITIWSTSTCIWYYCVIKSTTAKHYALYRHIRSYGTLFMCSYRLYQTDTDMKSQISFCTVSDWCQSIQIYIMVFSRQTLLRSPLKCITCCKSKLFCLTLCQRQCQWPRWWWIMFYTFENVCLSHVFLESSRYITLQNIINVPGLQMYAIFLTFCFSTCALNIYCTLQLLTALCSSMPYHKLLVEEQLTNSVWFSLKKQWM